MNYPRTKQTFVTLLASGCIAENKHRNVSKNKKTITVYPTYSLTTKGFYLINRLEELDKIMPFERLREDIHIE